MCSSHRLTYVDIMLQSSQLIKSSGILSHFKWELTSQRLSLNICVALFSPPFSSSPQSRLSDWATAWVRLNMKSLKAKFRKTDVSSLLCVTCVSDRVCCVHVTVCAHVYVCTGESLSVYVWLEQSGMIFGRIPQFWGSAAAAAAACSLLIFWVLLKKNGWV